MLFTVAITCFLFGCSQNPQTHTVAESTKSSENEPTQPASTANASGEKPDEKSDSKALAARVLMRPDFIGRVKMCYMVAKQIPELCQKLFCYCGCDYTDEHMTLLDCYTSDHSVDCDYCKGEAMMAFRMNRKGSSIAEIQKAIDLNWGPHYPWYEQPMPAIKKYWRTRLWAPGSGPTAVEKHDEGKAILDPFTGSQAANSKPESKPSGSCCGGSKDMKTAKSTKRQGA